MKTQSVMNSKQIFYLLIAVTAIVIAFGVFTLQESAPPARLEAARQPAAPGALAASQPYFNFGNVSMAAGKVAHRYKIRNTGSATETVTRLYTSCMCTEATLITATGKRGPFGMPGHGVIPTINERIAPGVEAVVEIVFDPAAHGPAGIGLIERVITLRTSAGQALELHFSATVRP